MTLPNGDDNGAGVSGVEHHKCTVLTVVLDHETLQVTFAVKDTPISVLQMMAAELTTQLEIMRRQAATMEMLQQRASAAQTQQIIEGIRNRR